MSNPKQEFIRAIGKYGEDIIIINDGKCKTVKAVVNVYRKPLSREVYGLMPVYSSPAGKSSQMLSLMIEPDCFVSEDTVILRRGERYRVIGAAAIPAGKYGDIFTSALAASFVEGDDDYTDFDSGEEGGANDSE